MSETKSNRPGCNQASIGGIAERLRWIISEIEQLGDQQIPQVYVHVGLQVMNDGPEQWPQRKHLIETLSAAFGAIPKYGDGLYRAAVEHGLSIYGSCPPPPQERREKLLAELAVVDAEIEREQAEAAPEAVVHEEKRAWGGKVRSCGVECACGKVYGNFTTTAEARSHLRTHIADAAELAAKVAAETTATTSGHYEVNSFSAVGDDQLAGVECACGINFDGFLSVHYARMALQQHLAVEREATPLESAARQLRTSRTGDEFAAGVGSLMDALAAAAEAEDESERAS